MKQDTHGRTDRQTDNMQFLVWHGSQNLCQTINTLLDASFKDTKSNYDGPDMTFYTYKNVGHSLSKSGHGQILFHFHKWNFIFFIIFREWSFMYKKRHIWSIALYRIVQKHEWHDDALTFIAHNYWHSKTSVIPAHQGRKRQSVYCPSQFPAAKDGLHN